MTIDAGGEAATTERDYEAEASEQGWRPQEEWTGKPEHWKDAKTWVENGDTKARIAKVEKEYADRFSRLEKATQRATSAVIASYEKQIDTLKAEKKAAIKEGDADRVEEIDQQIEGLKTKKSDAPESVAKAYEDFDDNFAPASQDTPEWKVLRDGFFKANPWMIDEPDMAQYATEVSNRNVIANPEIGFKANMKFVIDRVKKKFPAYFTEEKPAANGHAAVDAGGSFAGSTRTKKTFSDLPKEAQSTYERFDPKIKAVLSKEQYTKEYLADA